MENKKQVQRINWAITINNPEDGEEKLFKSARFKYTVFGREHFGETPEGWEPTSEQIERGQATWTPHLQGMVSCWKKMDFRSIKKHFPRANIKPCDLNYIKYCKKDGDFVEYGELPLTGGESTKKNWNKGIL